MGHRLILQSGRMLSAIKTLDIRLQVLSCLVQHAAHLCIRMPCHKIHVICICGGVISESPRCIKVLRRQAADLSGIQAHKRKPSSCIFCTSDMVCQLSLLISHCHPQLVWPNSMRMSIQRLPVLHSICVNKFFYVCPSLARFCRKHISGRTAYNAAVAGKVISCLQQ